MDLEELSTRLSSEGVANRSLSHIYTLTFWTLTHNYCNTIHEFICRLLLANAASMFPFFVSASYYWKTLPG